MAMNLYINFSGTGTVWELENSWEYGCYPVLTRDKEGTFYLFYIDFVLPYRADLLMEKHVNGADWDDWSTPQVVTTGLVWGDIGATYNSDIDRLFVSCWFMTSDGLVRKVFYSDDKGDTWTEVTVD